MAAEGSGYGRPTISPMGNEIRCVQATSRQVHRMGTRTETDQRAAWTDTLGQQAAGLKTG